MTHNVSFVIPANNEARGIQKIIELLILLCENEDCVNAFEIIVVDDGSTDNTKAYIPQHEKVTIICHDKRLGYGASLKEGILMAQYNVIGIVDADNTYEIEKIPKLLSYLHTSDMIVGKRHFLKGSTCWTKYIGRKLLALGASYLAGRVVHDANSGFRIFRKDVFNRVLPFIPSGFSFTTTITLAALFFGYSVQYVSVNYAKRMGVSKTNLLNFFTCVRVLGVLGLRFKPYKIIMPLLMIISGVTIACLL